MLLNLQCLSERINSKQKYMRLKFLNVIVVLFVSCLTTIGHKCGQYIVVDSLYLGILQCALLSNTSDLSTQLGLPHPTFICLRLSIMPVCVSLTKAQTFPWYSSLGHRDMQIPLPTSRQRIR